MKDLNGYDGKAMTTGSPCTYKLMKDLNGYDGKAMTTGSPCTYKLMKDLNGYDGKTMTTGSLLHTETIIGLWDVLFVNTKRIRSIQRSKNDSTQDS